MSVELMSKMARRLLSLVGRAKVTTSDDAGPIQTLQGKFNDLEVIDGMPRAAIWVCVSLARWHRSCGGVSQR